MHNRWWYNISHRYGYWWLTLSRIINAVLLHILQQYTQGISPLHPFFSVFLKKSKKKTFAIGQNAKIFMKVSLCRAPRTPFLAFMLSRILSPSPSRSFHLLEPLAFLSGTPKHSCGWEPFYYSAISSGWQRKEKRCKSPTEEEENSHTLWCLADETSYVFPFRLSLSVLINGHD